MLVSIDGLSDEEPEEPPEWCESSSSSRSRSRSRSASSDAGEGGNIARNVCCLWCFYHCLQAVSKPLERVFAVVLFVAKVACLIVSLFLLRHNRENIRR
jgi:hypothetical protein